MMYVLVPCLDKTIFESNLKNSLNNFKDKTEVILIEGNLGICRKYNEALDNIKEQLNDDDIVVFSHDDITIRDEYICEKVKLYFEHMPNVALAGIIGTTKYSNVGGWWHEFRETNARGKIIQGKPNGESYLMDDCNGNFNDLVCVDGCIMFMRGIIAKKYRFDFDTLKGYHFYDYDICFTLLKDGYDIGVIDVLVEHKSEGPLKNEWYVWKDIFQKKWETLKYPITKNQFKNI